MTQQRRSPGVRSSGASGARGTGARAGAGAQGAGRVRGRPVAGRIDSGRSESAWRGGAARTTGRTAAGPGAAPGATAARAGEGPRGSARPAARRSGAGKGSGAAKRTRAPEPSGLTTRAAVLATVLLGLLLAYAYPVRVYLAQQAEISALETQQAAQRRKIDDLAEQRAKWDDPEYVKSQARRRLQYILPGETPYVVIGGDQETTESDTTGTTQPEQPPPWYGKLWSSIAAADRR